MQFEDSKSLSVLSVLLELYSVVTRQSAVEFYEARDDPKFLQYRKRMKKLLTRDDVLALLGQRERKSEGSLPAPDPEGSTGSFPCSGPCRQSGSVAIQTSCLSLATSLSGLFTSTESSVSCVIRGIKNDLRIQNNTLQQRLQARKQAKRSFSFRASFEQELESLLETFLLEKATLRSKVSEQYDAQLAEVSTLATRTSNGLLEKVGEEMRKARDREYVQIDSQLSARKQSELSALHKKWLR